MPTVVERMASSVHALLTLEGETFGALRPRRAQLRQGFGRQSGQSRYQQDDEAADEGAPTEGADAEPWQRFQHAGSPPLPARLSLTPYHRFNCSHDFLDDEALSRPSPGRAYAKTASRNGPGSSAFRNQTGRLSSASQDDARR